MNPKRRRSYKGEQEWFHLLDDPGHVPLRRAFIDCGISPTMAGQLVWFLEEQRSLDRHLNRTSRASYRAILEGIDHERLSRAIPSQFNSAFDDRVPA